MGTIPAWLRESDELKRSEERHSWMCEQLLHRRNAQILDGLAEDVNARALRWYEDLLSWILSEGAVSKVVEVLSDGLGFIEPNWHAVDLLRGDTSGINILKQNQLIELKSRIATARAKLKGTPLKTQRAIGQDLYEPGLFLVTGDKVFFYRPRGPATADAVGAALAAWVPLSNSSREPSGLPVIQSSGIILNRSEEIAGALGQITREVLWSCLLPKGKNYFSLIFLHTSLWQETAGVWALHVAADGELREIPNSVDLASIRRLIESPVFCLEDVLGWSYEFEGTHRWKRHNVDFFRECLGMERPKWTPDGITYSQGDTQLKKDADRAAYELPVERLPSRSIRDIFSQAIKIHAEECSEGGIAFEHLSSQGKKIVRAVEATVVGLRLGDLEELRAKSPSPHANSLVGISDLPSTSDLYLRSAELELGFSAAAARDLIERGKCIAEKIKQAPLDSVDKDYCSVVIGCLDNYIASLEKRRIR